MYNTRYHYYFLRLCIRFATSLCKRNPKRFQVLECIWLLLDWKISCVCFVTLTEREYQLYTLSWGQGLQTWLNVYQYYLSHHINKHKYIRIINYLMSKFLSVFPSNWRFLAGNGTTWWLSTVSASELGIWWSRILLNYYGLGPLCKGHYIFNSLTVEAFYT